jgi:hypothetical protein
MSIRYVPAQIDVNFRLCKFPLRSTLDPIPGCGSWVEAGGVKGDWNPRIRSRVFIIMEVCTMEDHVLRNLGSGRFGDMGRQKLEGRTTAPASVQKINMVHSNKQNCWKLCLYHLISSRELWWTTGEFVEVLVQDAAEFTSQEDTCNSWW